MSEAKRWDVAKLEGDYVWLERGESDEIGGHVYSLGLENDEALVLYTDYATDIVSARLEGRRMAIEENLPLWETEVITALGKAVQLVRDNCIQDEDGTLHWDAQPQVIIDKLNELRESQ